MNKLLNHLSEWKFSKSKILDSESFDVEITSELGDSKKARYLDIYGNGLAARATIWEDGALELEAINQQTEKTVIQKSCTVVSVLNLDDELNWWLSEIAIYEP